MGPPLSYTQALGERICREIASGRTITSICKSDDFPHFSTVSGWASVIPEFSVIYSEARVHQAEIILDRIVDLADDLIAGKLGSNIRGVEAAIRALQWAIGKLAPQKYGDRVQTAAGVNITIITSLNLDGEEEAKVIDASYTAEVEGSDVGAT